MRQLFEETGTPRRLAEFIVARMPGAPNGTAPVEPPVERAESADPVPPRIPAAQTLAPAQTPAPAPAQTPAPAPAQTPAPRPVPPAPVSVPTSAPEYATREELEDLAHKIQQMSRIQLQMMSQLSQLLALQTAAVTDRLNGKVAQ
jgi:hypothetical protein